MFSGIDGQLPWQQDPASAATITPTASHARSAAVDVAKDALSLSNVKRILWSIDGKLLAVSKSGSLLRNLQGSKFDVNTLPSGDHVLAAHVETTDGHTYSFSAPFTSSKPVTPKASASSKTAVNPKISSPKNVARSATPSSAASRVVPGAPKPVVHTSPTTTPSPSKSASKPASAPTSSASKPASRPAVVSVPTKTPAPSPTPSSAPSQPAPAAPGGAFDPVHFNWGSVGGPTSGLTAVGGSTDLVLRTAGQILDRIQTNSKVVAQAAGVGVSNCSIGVFHADGSNLTAKNCTISGGVFGAGSYTLDHNFITSQADGIDPGGTGRKVIQYNKIWRDGTRVGDKHQDGIQFTAGGNALITRNWIGGYGTSAIMVKADLGTISNVTIDSNFLDNPTGYFQLYLCPVSHSLTNITVTNNAFGKASSTLSTCGSNLTFVHTEAQRQAGINAGVKGADQWIVWNNNYVAATGAVVAPTRRLGPVSTGTEDGPETFRSVLSQLPEVLRPGNGRRSCRRSESTTWRRGTARCGH